MFRISTVKVKGYFPSLITYVFQKRKVIAITGCEKKKRQSYGLICKGSRLWSFAGSLWSFDGLVSLACGLWLLPVLVITVLLIFSS